LAVLASILTPLFRVSAQEDKKTDDQRPADPDTGESTVEESTLNLLPDPFQNYGIKFAATYIGETQGRVLIPAVAGKPSQQALGRRADRKAGDDIAGPVGEQQHPAGDEAGADRPDDVALA
jgi:hypothetical protein